MKGSKKNRRKREIFPAPLGSPGWNGRRSYGFPGILLWHLSILAFWSKSQECDWVPWDQGTVEGSVTIPGSSPFWNISRTCIGTDLAVLSSARLEQTVLISTFCNYVNTGSPRPTGGKPAYHGQSVIWARGELLQWEEFMANSWCSSPQKNFGVGKLGLWAIKTFHVLSMARDDISGDRAVPESPWWSG